MDTQTPQTLPRALRSLATANQLPSGFAGLSPTEQWKALLDLKRPDLFIRSLRGDDFHRLVKGIGLEDAGDLMAYATPQQQAVFLDIEVWAATDFVHQRFIQVMQINRDISLDHTIRWMQNLDPELLALHLLSFCNIQLQRDTEPDEVPEHSFLTPDGWFLISSEDPESVANAREFLDLLYAAGLTFAHKILFATLYDTRFSLQDQAFRFRDWRLQEAGFPPDSERFTLWEPFDIKSLQMEPLEGGPALYPKTVPLALALGGQQHPLFLWHILDLLMAEKNQANIGAWMTDALGLVNRVLATRTSDYSDDGAWKHAASHALTMMSLGLSHITQDKEEEALQRLPELHPVYLYRAGIEILRPLHLRAIRIVRDIGGQRYLYLYGPLLQETLLALLEFPPRFYGGLTTPGHILTRDFQTLSEIADAKKALGQADLILKFARSHLGFSPSSSQPLNNITFANLLATLMLRFRLIGKLDPSPLPKDLLHRIRDAFQEDGELLVQEMLLTCTTETEDPENRALLTSWIEETLTAVQDTLEKIDPAYPVDPRFIGDVLLIDHRE